MSEMNKLDWFEAARFGLFLHWGAYSVRGLEASWPLVWGDISYAEYEAMADRFKPARYDAAEWAALAKAAGVRYAVLTTKHHDGFAMWDTQLSDYSAAKRAAGRDLIRPYVEAFRAGGIRVGFYFSLPDWHHPDYPVAISDPTPRHQRPMQALPPGAPASIAAAPERWGRYLSFMHGQVRELCTRFGKIDLLWFDGQWEHTAAEWRSAELVAMVRGLQPNIVINNRLALDDATLGDYDTPEQVVPVTRPARVWETCITINETWSYNPKDRAFKPVAELLATLAEVVSKGGNLLLDAGPTPEGEIPPEFASRLRVMGQWLAENGESIYGTGPGLPAGAYSGLSTGMAQAVYLHLLGYPAGGVIRVRGLDRAVKNISLLGTGEVLVYDQHGGVLEQGLLRISLPEPGSISPYGVVKIAL
jgi:alpha-L-fucosidase